MRYSLLALAASVAFVSAQDDCQDAYNTCIASGANETKCQCDLATCSGEDPARTREYCSSVLASLSSASSTAAPTSSKSASMSASIITGTAGSQPSGQAPITAPAGSIPLGGTCSDDDQCAGENVECWGSNAGIIRRCGNFNAGCKADTDCAYNTCNNGLCSGFLNSASYLANSASATASATSAPSYAASSSATSSTSSHVVLGGGNYTSTGTAAPTYSATASATEGVYTGSASSVGYGFAAAVFGFVAWIM